jgi:hypothetical protein
MRWIAQAPSGSTTRRIDRKLVQGGSAREAAAAASAAVTTSRRRKRAVILPARLERRLRAGSGGRPRSPASTGCLLVTDGL